MDRVLISLVFLFLGVIIAPGEGSPTGPPRPPSNTFTEEPPRGRIHLYRSAHGHQLNLGVRGEYDIAHSEDGKRLTAYGQGSQGIGNYNGHWYLGRPQWEVGLGAHIPF
uniref:Putative secreted salivary gland peptide ixodes scapularis secreted salivary gland peptide n=1 Tax=Amblyomma triste TaxID=251400 RepID=A0A023G437_AMBTT